MKLKASKFVTTDSSCENKVLDPNYTTMGLQLFYLFQGVCIDPSSLLGFNIRDTRKFCTRIRPLKSIDKH